jgi:hypothetical protein
VGEQRQERDQQETPGAGDRSNVFEEKPPQDEVDEIEAERQRRLAPENRPANAEVDNTDATLPTVEEFAKLNAGDEQEGSAGNADPGAAFRGIEPSQDEIDEIEAERARRLAPENRPANSEVDNTGDNMPDIAKS